MSSWRWPSQGASPAAEGRSRFAAPRPLPLSGGPTRPRPRPALGGGEVPFRWVVSHHHVRGAGRTEPPDRFEQVLPSRTCIEDERGEELLPGRVLSCCIRKLYERIQARVERRGDRNSDLILRAVAQGLVGGDRHTAMLGLDKT